MWDLRIDGTIVAAPYESYPFAAAVLTSAMEGRPVTIWDLDEDEAGPTVNAWKENRRNG